MKYFVDSAKLDEINEAIRLGAEGVTTNPSLMKKAVRALNSEGKEVDMIKNYIIQILEAAEGKPVSLEVTEITEEGMVNEGRRLFEMFRDYGNVNIKVPINPALSEGDDTQLDGFYAIKKLSELGIPINCTLIFTPEQALLAAEAGAWVVSPFAGRMDDYLRDQGGVEYGKTDYYPAKGMFIDGKILNDRGVVSGIDLADKCRQIITHYALKTKVLAASLRNPRQVAEAEAVRADLATVPLAVIKKMKNNPQSYELVEREEIPPELKKIDLSTLSPETMKSLLSHPKTYEGMRGFVKDIVPEYARLAR